MIPYLNFFLQSLRIHHDEELAFTNCVRMNKDSFDFILKRITPELQSMDPIGLISPYHQLLLTMSYLTTRFEPLHLSLDEGESPNTIREVVIRVCEAIVSKMKYCIKIPETDKEWKKEVSAFQTRWCFPNCLGVIDGKHILIKQPTESASYYLNYKNKYSISFMVVVNAYYEFLYVSVGLSGGTSPTALVGQTTFLTALRQKIIQLPAPKQPRGYHTTIPFVFVAGKNFPTMDYIIRPFNSNTEDDDEKHYNSRLSWVQLASENALGRLACKYRVLKGTMDFTPVESATIVMACCCLHNFLLKKKDFTYLFSVLDYTSFDIAYKNWLPIIDKGLPEANNIRNIFTAYFKELWKREERILNPK